MQGAGPLRKEGFNQGEGSRKSHTKDLPVLLPSVTQSLTESWQPEPQRWKGRGTESELERESKGSTGSAPGEEMNECPKGSCNLPCSGILPKSK